MTCLTTAWIGYLIGSILISSFDLSYIVYRNPIYLILTGVGGSFKASSSLNVPADEGCCVSGISYSSLISSNIDSFLAAVFDFLIFGLRGGLGGAIVIFGGD